MHLDISPGKSKITNLRRNKSEFLGFSLKAAKKRNRYVANTSVSCKKKKIIQRKIRQHIINIQKSPTYESIAKYNTYILGIQNYYRIATHVTTDFRELAYRLNKTIFNRLKTTGKWGVPRNQNITYKKYFKNNYRTFEIQKVNFYPIADIKTKNALNFTQDKCNYTIKGRKLLEHKYLANMIKKEINTLMYSTTEYNSMEYLDNRISKYSMQKGCCAITGEFLPAERVHCHHVLPKSLGGTDKYKNLVIVSKEVHRLIHATTKMTIKWYVDNLQLDGKQLKKIDIYRKKCNLEAIKE